jgi:lysophospholipase L1-like esterase
MTPDYAAWEEQVAALERLPFQPGHIVFAGSSTIRLWATLEEDFTPRTVYRRGFGGAKFSEVEHFAPRLILPLKPRQIVLFGGGMDLMTPATPAEVARSFASLTTFLQMHTGAHLSYIELTTSPSTTHLSEPTVQLNALLQAHCAAEGIDFVPARQKLLPSELFSDDRLHLNPAGYRVLAEAVRPFLRETGV